MQDNNKYNRQIEINDLIDDAIANAVARRELVETLSDDEAARVEGGLTVLQDTKLAVSTDPLIAGFKQICPPPIKPIEPICPPPIKPIKPICPPIIVGLIALPDDKTLA